MSPRAMIAYSLIHIVSVAFSQNVDDIIANCPATPGLVYVPKYSTSTSAPAMDSTCIAINLTVNVENVLPDPSYIIPKENIDIIQTSLQQTLSNYGVTTATINPFSSSTIPTSWTVNNECPSLTDNTATKFNFVPTSQNIAADPTSMNINYAEQQAQINWKFTTPETIVFDFIPQSVSSLIAINCVGYQMRAHIVDNSKYVLAESDIITVIDNTNNQQAQLMTFTTSNFDIQANTNYFVYISVFGVSQCTNNELQIYSTNMPESAHPVISILAEPSSCKLARTMGYENGDPEWKFGIDALCKKTLPDRTRQLFELFMYKQHKSKASMSYAQVQSIPTGVRRRRILTNEQEVNSIVDMELPEPVQEPSVVRRRLGCCGTGSNPGPYGSLHLISAEGADHLVAPDPVFPNYDQCLAMNPETLRTFSVGGNTSSGAALNRIAVYDYVSLIELKEIQDWTTWGLQLTEPRAYGMCIYYKNIYNGNNREYIMVISGVKDLADLSNSDLWYNDIVFIPLDYTERTFNNLPKIQLKHKVIDPRLYVTDNNGLYIFGGRDGINAKNYVQYIDLNVVFSSTSADTLTTMDRFEPMRLNRIAPIIDTKILKAGDIYDECIMVFGGEDFVNNAWVDIEIPPNGLQLYCNQIDPTAATTSQTAHAELTQFDIDNIKKVTEFISPTSTTKTISINRYNFVDDNILYKFTSSYKACFANDAQIKTTENLFKSTIFQNQLGLNILTTSQNRFKGWNNGFSKVYIENIDLAKATEIVDNAADLNSLCSGLSELSCHSKVDMNGKGLCGYNVNDGSCFAVVPISGQQGTGTFDDGYDEGENEGNIEKHHIEIIIAVLSAAISILLIVVTAKIVHCLCKKKEQSKDNKKEMDVSVKKVKYVQTQSIDIAETNDI